VPARAGPRGVPGRLPPETPLSAPLRPPRLFPRSLQDLERDEESLSDKDCVREKLSLIHGFLQADVQDQLVDLESRLRREELSEERYLAKVKALLRRELSAENGDAAPLLPASNGCSKNGAYGSDEDSERAGPDGEEDGAMEMEEAAASSSSSSSSSAPTPPARKARRSRSNGESKSNLRIG
ncbi:DNMT1 methyltransferase, partial [Nothoprocta ornata]|nr:DNMT1 methyltransferase [Nothoprocta ornata]